MTSRMEDNLKNIVVTTASATYADNSSVGNISTGGEGRELVFSHGIQNANLVICAGGLIVSIYVALALSIYQYVRSKRIGVHSKRNARERRLGSVARTLCILVAIMTGTFSGIKLLTLLIEHRPADEDSRFQNCNILFKAANVTLYISSFLAYMFLWTRQRVFYIHKALAHINSMALAVTSYVILGVWIFYCVSASVAIILATEYTYVENTGCVIKFGYGVVMKMLGSSFVIVCAFMQVSLLVLFIYPIVRRSSISREMSRRRSSDNGSLGRVMNRVKRAIALSVICIFSDIIALIVARTTHSRSTNSFMAIYVINLSINMFCIILCFDNWAKMLVPCAKSKSQRMIQPSTTSNSTQQQANTISREWKADEKLTNMPVAMSGPGTSR